MEQHDNLVSQKKVCGFLFGYGVAVVSTALAALLRWWLPWALSPAPYLGFYPAVVVSAALGGVGPGLASTFGSLFLVNFVFGRFDPSDTGAMMRQVIWVVASIGVSLLAGKMAEARSRARQEAEVVRESKEQLTFFTEYAPAALAMFDRNMCYLNVSRRWRDDYGLEELDLLGKSHYEVFPEISDEWKEAHRRGLAGEVLRAEADRFERADGMVHWVRWEIRPWYTITGDIGGIVIFTEDITDKKKTEEILLRYELIAQNSRDIVIFMRCEDGRILEANAAAVDAYGYDYDELLGMTIRDLRASEAKKLTTDQMEEADRQGIIFETVHQRKDGSTFNAEVSSQGANIGATRTLISIIRDITKRKQAEESLRKLNEELDNKVIQRTTELREKDQMLLLQSRQAAMGEMIGNIAHQWRQPLNILGLQIQQLQLFYDIGQFNKELLDNNTAEAMKLIQHMSKTIDDFRNYFKPDKEKVEFNVHESIKHTLSLLEGNMKNPPIVVNVVAKDDPVIFGYQNEFAQVILNILTNARDIIIEKNVSEPKLDINIFREDMCSVVTIADNAGGISEDIITKIFDPYFTTKGPQHGTGVGLYMSKAIIEKNMGGRLLVRNIADGAEFRIEVGNGYSH